MDLFDIIERKDIDKAKWQKASAHLSLYAQMDYLDVVCQYQWKAIVWNSYEKIIPFFVQSTWGCQYICMPPFVQKWDVSQFSTDELGQILLFFKKKYFLTDIRWSQSVPNTNAMSIKNNYILWLKDIDYTSIAQNYHSLLKRNLKRQIALEVKKHESIYPIKSFFETNELFLQVNSSYQQTIFWSIVALKSPSIQPTFYSIHKGNSSDSILACIVAVKFNHIEYLICPYSTPEGKKLQAMSYLIDYIIQHEELDAIDFEGSSIDAIAAFYRQFGSENTPYFQYKMRPWYWLK